MTPLEEEALPVMVEEEDAQEVEKAVNKEEELGIKILTSLSHTTKALCIREKSSPNKGEKVTKWPN